MSGHLKISHLAPLSLILAAGGFAATLGAGHPAAKCAHAFFEAAMVGGLADWFAVVALFRHPLNLPIPHTSIIKKNRRKITERIVDALQNQWLTREAISKKIAGYDFAAEASAFLRNDTNRAQIAAIVDTAVAAGIEKFEASNPDFSGILSKIGGEIGDANLMEPVFAALDKNRHNLRALALDEAENWLMKPETAYVLKDKIRFVISNYAQKHEMVRTAIELGESLGILNYEYITGELVRVLVREIDHSRVDEGHELNAQLDRVIGNLTGRVRSNEKLSALPAMMFAMAASRIDIKAAVVDEAKRRRGEIAGVIMETLDGYAGRLASDAGARDGFNSWFRSRISEFVNNNHEEIGKIVRENIDGIDDDDLVDQIEEKVGEDLQYIRLNGAIVGGLVGVIIYALRAFIG